LGEFHKIYNSGAFGNKYEMIRFLGQQVKVMTRPYMVKKTEAYTSVAHCQVLYYYGNSSLMQFYYFVIMSYLTALYHFNHFWLHFNKYPIIYHTCKTWYFLSNTIRNSTNTNQHVHCEPNKTHQIFCHIFHKTQSILIKLGTHCPE